MADQSPFERMSDLVSHFVSGYELMDCEDDQGRCGDYQPNEHERMLIEDAINGLICDEEFCELLIEGREVTQAARKAEGSCIHCGAPNGYDHYGKCRAIMSSTAGERTYTFYLTVGEDDGDIR